MEKQLSLFDTASHIGDIKAISLWQPWASLICLGFKKYETRSWTTNYRGELVICSAKKKTKQQQQEYSRLAAKYQLDVAWDDLLFGYAIAICDLTNCIKMTNDLIKTIPITERDCGEWQPDRYAWKLENIKILDDPVPIKGKQRLWNIKLDLESKPEIIPKQLNIFDGLGDIEKVSPNAVVGDTENQALQRFLDRAKPETTLCIKKYKPNGRKTEYFRLDYRIGNKVKSIHIPGGNIRAKLAQNRAKELQTMIDRGAEVAKILATVANYRGVKKNEN